MPESKIELIDLSKSLGPEICDLLGDENMGKSLGKTLGDGGPKKNQPHGTPETSGDLLVYHIIYPEKPPF